MRNAGGSLFGSEWSAALRARPVYAGASDAHRAGPTTAGARGRPGPYISCRVRSYNTWTYTVVCCARLCYACAMLCLIFKFA